MFNRLIPLHVNKLYHTCMYNCLIPLHVNKLYHTCMYNRLISLRVNKLYHTCMYNRLIPLRVNKLYHTCTYNRLIPLHVSKLYHTFMYNCLPEDEPSGLKHVEDIIKIKYYFNKSAFCWFILHGGSSTCCLLLSCTDLMSRLWKLTAFSLCCDVDGLPLHTFYSGDSWTFFRLVVPFVRSRLF
jgi:hypothetical protein